MDVPTGVDDFIRWRVQAHDVREASIMWAMKKEENQEHTLFYYMSLFACLILDRHYPMPNGGAPEGPTGLGRANDRLKSRYLERTNYPPSLIGVETSHVRRR